jgi:hypothetical protein
VTCSSVIDLCVVKLTRGRCTSRRPQAQVPRVRVWSWSWSHPLDDRTQLLQVQHTFLKKKKGRRVTERCARAPRCRTDTAGTS